MFNKLSSALVFYISFFFSNMSCTSWINLGRKTRLKTAFNGELLTKVKQDNSNNKKNSNLFTNPAFDLFPNHKFLRWSFDLCKRDIWQVHQGANSFDMFC